MVPTGLLPEYALVLPMILVFGVMAWCAAMKLQPERAIKTSINGPVVVITLPSGPEPLCQTRPPTDAMKPVAALREFAAVVLILVRHGVV